MKQKRIASRSLAIASFITLLTAPFAMAQGNLLVNGNFDTDPRGTGKTTLTGWRVLYGTIDLVSEGGILYSQSGRSCLELTGTPGASAVSQTVVTKSGTNYSLSGYVSHHPGVPFGEANIYINGQLWKSISASGPYPSDNPLWIPWQGTFVATSNSTEIKFVDVTNLYDYGGAVIDTVYLAEAGATYTVTNIGNSGTGSLRQAILNANAHTGRDTIAFAIPGSGVKTIALTSALPDITGATIIDATTQPGYDVTPLVELSGTSAGDVRGITLRGISSSNSAIRALIVNNFKQDGIAVFDGNTDTLIEKCFIGTNSAGTSAKANQQSGIVAGNAVALTVRSNVVSGNTNVGIGIYGSPYSLVEDNLAGTDASGSLPIGNRTGIEIETNSSESRVLRNVASANRQGGIFTGRSCYIAHNFVGSDSTGLFPLGNNGDGIGIQNDSIVEYNLVSANVGKGISVQGSSRSVVRYNTVGTDITRTIPLGNTLSGIHLDYENTNDNELYGNFLGYSGDQGIFVASSARTKIHDNTIIGNNQNGIFLWDSATETLVANNVISSNLAGVGTAGYNNLIQGNTITGNTERGVFVTGINGTGMLGNANRITANNIFGNNGLGIDLGEPFLAPDANDEADVDGGTNLGQNYPVLTGVSANGGSTLVRGTLNSKPNTVYRVEVFSNNTVSPSGHGEGETYIGFVNVITNSSGNASFTATFPFGLGNRVVTTTATDPAGNTSEFSRPFLTPRLTVTVTNIIRNAGTIIATISIQNLGNGIAKNAKLNTATLSVSVPQPATNMQQNLGDIAPGGSVVIALQFPATVGNPGTIALLRTNSSWEGGSCNSSNRFTLP